MGELVVNASPLIFLANAGYLDLLRSEGDTHVVVPQAVHDEITAGGREDAAAKALRVVPWLRKVGAVVVPEGILAWDLGAGESAVIATALALPAEGVIIDDMAGRRCALACGLRVSGTLGLVLRAEGDGRIDDARMVLAELRSRGMWLSDAVIDRALALSKSGPAGGG
jgi:predicted nucleic acid-binding protein